MTEEEKRLSETIARDIVALQSKVGDMEKQRGMTNTEVINSAEFKAVEERIMAHINEVEKSIARARIAETVEKTGGTDATDIYFKQLRGTILYEKRGIKPECTDAELNLIKSLTHKQPLMTKSDYEAGGAWSAMPTVARDVIELNAKNMNTLQNHCRMERTATKEFKFPTAYSDVTIIWGGEALTPQDGVKTDGVIIPVHLQSAQTDIDIETIEDPGVNFKNYLLNAFAESMTVSFGDHMITGTGIKRPQGLLMTPGLVTYKQGHASKIDDADALVAMCFELQDVYMPNAAFGMRRPTMGTIASLKATDGHFLLKPLADATKYTVNGYPVVPLDAMPAEGSGALPVVFGDLRKAYGGLIKTTAYELIVDMFTQASTNKIRFTMNRFVGGGVINPTAFIALKLEV